MRIAFYAPMKSPNHPVPSGDRRIANLFLSALKESGNEPFLASEFRSYEGKGDPARQEILKQDGYKCAADLLKHWQGKGIAEKPDLWFTYHLYHKAPDWLGPKISEALAIPYVIAEASHAPKQAGGPWDLPYLACAKAIGQANLVLALTALDQACLGQVVRNPEALIHFPPFVECDGNEIQSPLPATRKQTLAAHYDLNASVPWLLTVAMMRPGDKERSYQLLADSLKQLTDDPWQAILIGSGEAADRIQDLFAAFGNRVKILPAQEAEILNQFYDSSDLYLWPAHNEAYGMTLLEAQSFGLPVIAGAEAGVYDVVRANVTGLLTDPGDASSFANAVTTMLKDPRKQAKMGQAARSFIIEERDLHKAGDRLNRLLQPLIQRADP